MDRNNEATALTIDSEQEYRRFYDLWQQSRYPVTICFTFWPANPFHTALIEYFVESTARIVPLPGKEVS